MNKFSKVCFIAAGVLAGVSVACYGYAAWLKAKSDKLRKEFVALKARADALDASGKVDGEGFQALTVLSISLGLVLDATAPGTNGYLEDSPLLRAEIEKASGLLTQLEKEFLG